MRNTLEFRLSSLWRFRSIINTTMRPIPLFPGPSLPPSLPSRFIASAPLSIYGDRKCWRLSLIRFNYTLHIVDVRLTCLINITYLLTYYPSWATASCLNAAPLMGDAFGRLQPKIVKLGTHFPRSPSVRWDTWLLLTGCPFRKHLQKIVKKRSERRKHCALAVVKRSQKNSPRRRSPSRGRGTAKI